MSRLIKRQVEISGVALGTLALTLFFTTMASAEKPQPRKSILITHFDPFGGAPENASKDAAQIAASLLPSEYDVKVLELPTVYDLAATVALETAKAIQASSELSAVISVGEGSCEIKLETLGRNRDYAPGFPDNAGITRGEQGKPDLVKIDEVGPLAVAMPFPVRRAFHRIRWSTEESALLSLSDDAGAFVCNNTAYRLARHFSQPGISIPFTFVHVPNHGCPERQKNAKISGSVIAKLIREALQASQTP
ncbi:MAG: hypothetical protein KGQ59_12040 [Bdellovibrionales bacterium]|nr:hypothetical protein [Bdellovibrionales bacterium]